MPHTPEPMPTTKGRLSQPERIRYTYNISATDTRHIANAPEDVADRVLLFALSTVERLLEAVVHALTQLDPEHPSDRITIQNRRQRLFNLQLRRAVILRELRYRYPATTPRRTTCHP